MKLRLSPLLPGVVLAAGLLLSACGGSDVSGNASAALAAAESVAGTTSSTAETAESSTAEPSEAPAAALGSAVVGAFGTVVVDAQGLSVYGFTDDTDGSPTCVEACAKAWPALLADAAGTVPAGLDPALLTVVDRPDGGRQLKYGKWPLYYYAGDGAAGEALGQGVGGKWFLVAADGKLVKEAPTAETPVEAPAVTEAPAAEVPAAPAVEATAAPAGPVVGLADVGALGSVMVGANGHTLYAFTDDSKTTATCVDACAAAWPPLVVAEGFTISDDLVQSGVSTITRADGSLQLVMGDWPLYFYAGDGAPGDALGQGLNGKWFAISADCKLVKTAA